MVTLADRISMDVASARRANRTAIECARLSRTTKNPQQVRGWENAATSARKMRDLCMRSARDHAITLRNSENMAGFQ